MTRQSLDVSGYGSDAVSAALLASGRTLRFRYERLDSGNTPLGDMAGVITGGKVSHNYLADIKRTAQFTVVERLAGDVDWLNDRVRPWVGVRMPDGGFADWPQGVFLLSTPTRKYSGGSITRDVQGYDQTQTLTDDKITDRYVMAAADLITDHIRILLGPIPSNIADSDATFQSDRSQDPGTSKLDILKYCMQIINYELFVDGYGTAQVGPYTAPADAAPGWIYATDSRSVIGADVDQTLDLFAVPNLFVRVISQADRALLTSTFSNDNPNSPTSTVARGRTITDYADQSDAADQAALDAQVRQAAVEASQVYETVSLPTVLMPFHGDRDILTLRHAALGISADYSETAWDLDLKSGGQMSHSIRRVVDVDPS